MEVSCRDGLSGLSRFLEVNCETASQLLTQVCQLFERAEEDAALEMDGEIVWVAGSRSEEVAVRSLSLSNVVLRRDLGRVLGLAAQSWRHRDLPQWAWEERAVVLAAINEDAAALGHASEQLRNDRGFVLEAIRSTPNVSEKFGLGYVPPQVLLHASARLCDDRDVVVQAVRHNGGHALRHANTRFLDDRDLLLEAVGDDPASLELATARVRDDRDVVLEAVRHPKIGSASALKHASDRLRDDFDVVRQAVRHDGKALQYASARLRGDRALVLHAVRTDGAALLHASEGLKDDRSLVLEALKSGCDLDYASERLRNDRDLVLASLNCTRPVFATEFRDINPLFCNDREVMLLAVTKNSRHFSCASESLRDDRELVLRVIRGVPHYCVKQVFGCASERLRNDPELILEVEKKQRSAIGAAQLLLDSG